jgi:hypothetical protein
MKSIVTILLLFISFLSFGQRPQDTLLTKLRPFDLSDNGNLRLLDGNFTISDGMGGFTYRLDSSGTFERVDFADIGGSFISQKGTVRLNSNKQLELVSDEETSTFDIFVFDTFAFLIKPAKISDFQKDFTKAVSSFGKKKVYVIGDETYTAKFMIAFSLMTKYPVRGVD